MGKSCLIGEDLELHSCHKAGQGWVEGQLSAKQGCSEEVSSNLGLGDGTDAVCVHVWHTCAYVCTCVHVLMCECGCVDNCVYVCTCALCIYMCLYRHASMYACVYLCMCFHVFVCVCGKGPLE